MYKRKRITAPATGKRKTQKKKSGIVKRYSVSIPPGRLLSPTNTSTFIYHNSGQLNPGAGGIAATSTYRLSSLHDPDFTGIGHQPLGYDQIAALYERYQVWKVDFHICYINTDTTGVQRVGYTVSDVSDTSANGEIYIEQGNSEWDLLARADSNSKRILSGTVKLNDVHGVSYKQYMSNDDYGANFGANPAEEGYIKIWADGIGQDTGVVRYAITLIYHAKIMGSVSTIQS